MKDSQIVGYDLMLYAVLSIQLGCGTDTVDIQDQSFDDFDEWGNGIDDFSPPATENHNSIESYEEDSGDSGVLFTDFSDQYCLGADPLLVDCDPEINYDPWIAGTGEVHYWIRNKRTRSFPFSTEVNPEVYYGLFQITTGEAVRKRTEDIFHVWFSETPNGPMIQGEDCEWYTTYASGNVYWTNDLEFGPGACYLGNESRLLYANFETRCHPLFWEGPEPCDDENKNKSGENFQFDVSRRFKLYD